MLFSATLTLESESLQNRESSTYDLTKFIKDLNLQSKPKIIDLSNQTKTVKNKTTATKKSAKDKKEKDDDDDDGEEEETNEMEITKQTKSFVLPKNINIYRLITLDEREKDELLYYILFKNPNKKCLIFVNTIKCVKRLESLLTLLKYTCYSLHAKKQQRQRLKNLERFKQSKCDNSSDGNNNSKNVILIATDVAARGIDIPDVELVIHFHMSSNIETFIHRSGRTGRAGQNGLVICMIAPIELDRIKGIETALFHKSSLPLYPVDQRYMNVLKQRVTVAEQVINLNNQLVRSSLSTTWLERKAEDAGIIINKEVEIDEMENKQGKKQLKRLQAHLNSLLSQKVVPAGVSHSYVTANDMSLLL